MFAFITGRRDGVVSHVATTEPIHAIAACPAAKDSAQTSKLQAYFLAEQAPPRVRDAWRGLIASATNVCGFFESFPTTMIMTRNANSLESTHILMRGAYDKPGDTRVHPASRHASIAAGGEPPNRLALARWLVDPPELR